MVYWLGHHLFGKRKVVIVDHQPLSSIDHHLFGKKKVVIVDHQPLSLSFYQTSSGLLMKVVDGLQ
jgi:hypothetical protein